MVGLGGLVEAEILEVYYWMEQTLCQDWRMMVSWLAGRLASGCLEVCWVSVGRILGC